MCFRSAAEGQKAFLGRAADSISLYSEARKPEWQRNQGQLKSEGQGLGRESIRTVLDLDLNLNGRSEVRVDTVQAQSPTMTRGAKS